MEQAEREIDALLHDKKAELTQLKLAREALEKGLYDEYEVAVDMMGILKGSENAESASDDKDKEKTASANGKEEEEDAPEKIGTSDIKTLTEVATHLLKIDWIRDEVLSLPLLFSRLPNLPFDCVQVDTLVGIVIDLKPASKCARFFASTSSESASDSGIGNPQFAPEDLLLLGMHRADLIPYFAPYTGWEEEHFILLAETSPAHAKALLSEIEQFNASRDASAESAGAKLVPARTKLIVQALAEGQGLGPDGVDGVSAEDSLGAQLTMSSNSNTNAIIDHVEEHLGELASTDAENEDNEKATASTD